MPEPKFSPDKFKMSRLDDACIWALTHLVEQEDDDD